MNLDDIDDLIRLDLSATPAPWYIRRLDDEMCVSAIAISTKPDTLQNESMRSGKWPGGEIVAACLLVNPPYAVVDDGLDEINAKLIYETRNHISELLRLAKIGLAHENQY